MTAVTLLPVSLVTGVAAVEAGVPAPLPVPVTGGCPAPESAAVATAPLEPEIARRPESESRSNRFKSARMSAACW